jgi:hypothetical protein
MELVDAIEVLGLAEQHQVRVAPGPDEGEGPQQVAVGEVLAGDEELALAGRALLVREAPPGGIDLQKRVLDEVTYGHRIPIIRRPHGLPGGVHRLSCR